MDRQTSSSRRGTVFVYGIEAKGSEGASEKLHKIKQEWSDWRVVVVTDQDLANAAMSTLGWHENAAPQLGHSQQRAWREAQ